MSDVVKKEMSDVVKKGVLDVKKRNLFGSVSCVYVNVNN